MNIASLRYDEGRCAGAVLDDIFRAREFLTWSHAAIKRFQPAMKPLPSQINREMISKIVLFSLLVERKLQKCFPAPTTTW